MAVSPKSALLLSGLGSMVVLGSGMGILGPALPVYERSFSLTTAESGLLISTLWGGCLLSVLVMYFKGAEVTPRPGMALLTLGSVLLAVAPLWPVALAGALIFGFGYGLLAALFNPRILVAYGAQGASRLGMLNAVFSLGAILAPFGFALTGGDLRPAFWTMALCAALAFALSGKVGLTGVVSGGQTRGFRLHLPILAFALVAIGIEASLAGLGPTALIRAGISEERAAALLSLFFLAALAARVALVVVAHRVADFALFLFALLWATLCALGAALISPALFFPPLGIAAGLFFQGEYVTASRKMGADPRVSPIIIGVGLVGAVASPLVYARLMDGLGSHGFFWLVAGVAGLASAAGLASYRAMRR